MARARDRLSVPAFLVDQWLDSWGERRAPSEPGPGQPDGFYLFKMSARTLRSLSGVARRAAEGPRAADLAIQRAQDVNRSEEIVRYVRSGAMLAPSNIDSRASARTRQALRMPGWLPSSIIVNILAQADRRNRGLSVARDDLVSVSNASNGCPRIVLPVSYDDSIEWEPKSLHPLEIIDGQHRLLAFDDETLPDSYELPVVAFFALSLRWQAYLFWSINIKPKRISPSLAFDLYPIMRNEEWLKLTEDVQVYRDARAQELVEALWSTPESPFYKRINMLGEKGQGFATQAAWVRSLTNTFIKRWSAPNMIVGGLFGGEEGEEPEPPWDSPQQAAFLIRIFQLLFLRCAGRVLNGSPSSI